MSLPFDGATALASSVMLAISPITGACEGRVLSLCSGTGEVHKVLVWDDDSGQLPPRQPGPGKACHACLPDKRKAKDGHTADGQDV